MKLTFRLEPEHLIWCEVGRDRNTGCMKKSSIALVQRIRSETSTHIHVYTSKSAGHKPVFKTACTEDEAQAVLDWFYGVNFPPPEILAIRDPDAYKAALAAYSDLRK